MNLLHHCTVELFVTVVVGGSLAILITVFTFDKYVANSIPPGSRDLLEFGFFVSIGITAGSLGLI